MCFWGHPGKVLPPPPTPPPHPSRFWKSFTLITEWVRSCWVAHKWKKELSALGNVIRKWLFQSEKVWYATTCVNHPRDVGVLEAPCAIRTLELLKIFGDRFMWSKNVQLPVTLWCLCFCSLIITWAFCSWSAHLSVSFTPNRFTWRPSASLIWRILAAWARIRGKEEVPVLSCQWSPTFIAPEKHPCFGGRWQVFSSGKSSWRRWKDRRRWERKRESARWLFDSFIASLVVALCKTKNYFLHDSHCFSTDFFLQVGWMMYDWAEMDSVVGRKFLVNSQERILHRIYDRVTSGLILDVTDFKESDNQKLLHLVRQSQTSAPFPRNQHSSEGQTTILLDKTVVSAIMDTTT